MTRRADTFPSGGGSPPTPPFVPNYAILGSPATTSWTDVQTAHAAYLADYGSNGEFTVYVPHQASVVEVGTYDWVGPVRFVGATGTVIGGVTRAEFTVDQATPGVGAWSGPSFTFVNIDLLIGGSATVPLIGPGTSQNISVVLIDSSFDGAGSATSVLGVGPGNWSIKLEEGSYFSNQSIGDDGSAATATVRIELFDGSGLGPSAVQGMSGSTVPEIHWYGDTFIGGDDGTTITWPNGATYFKYGSEKYAKTVILNVPFDYSTTTGVPGDNLGGFYCPEGFDITSIHCLIGVTLGDTADLSFEGVIDGVIGGLTSTDPSPADTAIFTTPWVPPSVSQWINLNLSVVGGGGGTATIKGLYLAGTAQDVGLYPV